MNRPIGAFNTVRINIVRSTRNSIDAHDLTWPVYRNLRPWNVRWTVYHLLNWLSRKVFFYHFIAADVFVGCWSCSHLISVNIVSLLEDKHVVFDFGLNISLCILFLHPASIVVILIYPFSILTLLMTRPSWVLLQNCKDEDIFFVYKSRACGGVC